MHKVVVDRSHALVSLTATGFFSTADLADAAATLHATIRSLGPAMGSHVTLYDLTGLEIVAQPVLAAFALYVTDRRYAEIWARRVALVTRSAAVGLQMGRVSADRDDLKVFGDRGAAIAWLLAARHRVPAAV